MDADWQGMAATTMSTVPLSAITSFRNSGCATSVGTMSAPGYLRSSCSTTSGHMSLRMRSFRCTPFASAATESPDTPQKIESMRSLRLGLGSRLRRWWSAPASFALSTNDGSPCVVVRTSSSVSPSHLRFTLSFASRCSSLLIASFLNLPVLSIAHASVSSALTVSTSPTVHLLHFGGTVITDTFPSVSSIAEVSLSHSRSLTCSALGSGIALRGSPPSLCLTRASCSAFGSSLTHRW